MSDQQPKPTQMASVSMMAFTGLGSSAIGDQVGDALAKVLAWGIAIKCQCVPPEEIVGAFHTLCVALVVGLAFWVHSLFIKTSN